jgi:hypothetical protein
MSAAQPSVKPQVGCYVFPHYHPNPYNDRRFAPGWTEYELVKAARPWFPGHFQPRRPVLGELDERLPGTWEVYNRLAAANGIDAWIFDWYCCRTISMGTACSRRWRTGSGSGPPRPATR